MTVETYDFFCLDIPYIITEDQAKKWFAGCGKVWDIKIDKSKMEITAKMEYSSKEEADKALEILNNKEFPRSPRSYVKCYWG